jgi:hypothetical protein
MSFKNIIVRFIKEQDRYVYKSVKVWNGKTFYEENGNKVGNGLNEN